MTSGTGSAWGGPLDRAELRRLALDLASALAAIHASGLLHRDLKPANVLFDLEGDARISDFGLAVPIVDMGDADHRSGTGCYMAPELLDGSAPSERSDIHAFGLLLYEAMTGRRCYQSAGQVVVRAAGGDPPPRPSLFDPEVDPILERLTLRCLSVDPEQRPASAARVEEMLRLPDPIDAVFALGEEPSSRMIARADAHGLLSRRQAWFAVGVVVLLLAGMLFAGRLAPTTTEASSPTPERIAQEARAVIRAIGWRPRVDGHRYGAPFDVDQALPGAPWIPAASRGSDGRYPCWYRESATPLAPEHWLTLLLGRGRVRYLDPPLARPDITSVLLGSDGELLAFFAGGAEWTPRDGPSPSPASQPDWDLIFRLAGRTRAEYTENAGGGSSSVGFAPTSGVRADLRSYVWTAGSPPSPGEEEELHALAAGPRLLSFEVLRRAEVVARDAPRSGLINFFLVAGILALIIPVAVRHFRTGRGDLAGVSRLAAFTFVCISGSWLLVADYPATTTLRLLFTLVGLLAGLGGMLAIVAFHLALEPFSRRHWPRVLVSWSRVLRGKWSDPLAQSHALLGITLGLLAALGQSVLQTSGLGRPVTDLASPLLTEVDLPVFLSKVLGALPGALLLGFEYLVALVLARILLRRKWPAILVAGLVAATITSIDATSLPLVLWGCCFSTLSLVVLLRYGLLATTVYFATNAILEAFPPQAVGSSGMPPHFLGAGALMIVIAVILAARSSKGRPIRPPSPPSGYAFGE